MSELDRLSEFIVNLQQKDIPSNVEKTAVLHVLDTIGTAIGASSDLQIQNILKEWMKKGADGEVSIWGTGKRADLSTSVFLNSMMSHTQEMDDVHTKSKTHIGTVVVPAAWGVSEIQKKTGSDLLLAVICGYEVMSRIGMAFGVSSHRNLGWHVTATAGTFGAAAAAGKLMGLNKTEMIWALGLAGSQSFGTWAFLGDGSGSKVLNPARAAQIGVEAALLAKAGMSGPEHILTAEDGGLLNMMSAHSDAKLVTKGLGQEWQILNVDNKPYPSCRSTHCAIDGTLELCRKHGISAGDVNQIEVDTYLVGYKQCGSSKGSVEPETVVNAKFSTPFTVACAVLYGKVTLNQIKQEVINDPQVQDLIHRVKVTPMQAFTDAYPQHWGCKVRIHTKDKNCYETVIRDASGSVDRPLTEEEVKKKAIQLMEGTIGAVSEKYASEILHISEKESIADFMEDLK